MKAQLTMLSLLLLVTMATSRAISIEGTPTTTTTTTTSPLDHDDPWPVPSCSDLASPCQQQMRDDLNRLQSLVARQSALIATLHQTVTQQSTSIASTVKTLVEAELKNQQNHIIELVLEHIRLNGLRFGNRWKIQEEGTNSYEALVFRDMTWTNVGVDKRYAMFSGLYTDL